MALPHALEEISAVGFDYVELTPSHLLDFDGGIDVRSFANVKASVATSGLEVRAMQGLLHGLGPISILAGGVEQRKIWDRLYQVADIASQLGAETLVFGSPGARRAEGFGPERLHHKILSFFKRASEIADEFGVVLCVEPNPEEYGGDFLFTIEEAAKVVTAIQSPALQLQLDSGACEMAGDSIQEQARLYGALVSHCHFSAPFLDNPIPFISLLNDILRIQDLLKANNTTVEIGPDVLPSNLSERQKILKEISIAVGKM